MKVQQLIDRLADFRGDAEVTIWAHEEKAKKEYMMPVLSVARDSDGTVGINWKEDGTDSILFVRNMTDE